MPSGQTLPGGGGGGAGRQEEAVGGKGGREHKVRKICAVYGQSPQKEACP